ncbi:hypothetical protein B0T25DRAFT_596620 [Lasiosphaeria hispida]|uniref:Uncharacterized protein n=1 Tax=Lasiosphaeria hispida TaxID=260671 RepID=A0AAJ0HV63_9PEZI|nr:hypothetical protein B0T25DRAFT_596620 [Lasiosphaeria hispida]
MSSRTQKQTVYCVGSPTFDPETAIRNDATHEAALRALEDDDFETAIQTWFRIPDGDDYVYHAIASVTLAQVQRAVNLGGQKGLHGWYDWYRDERGEALPPPSPSDISAYASIFHPSTSTPAALRSFAANARKSSLRSLVAAHLTAHLHLPPPLATPKTKTPPRNPYFDLWTRTAHTLQWTGPLPSHPCTPTHPLLPILMHHFACAVPSHEALTLLHRLAAGRPIADVGSGSGYWTFMLRQYTASSSKVIPIDSAQSAWRTTWVPDTIRTDGARWLARPENDGGRSLVLLLVYPIVGGGLAGGVEGGFTRGLLAAYKGDTVAVVGTQNRNGYTGFRDMTMDEFMAKEHKDWVKVVQIPLPSFAGKDEALFVFQRGERISPRAGK